MGRTTRVHIIGVAFCQHPRQSRLAAPVCGPDPVEYVTPGSGQCSLSDQAHLARTAFSQVPDL
jgi:hypothetical protein